MKKISASDQQDSLNLQIELPLDISPATAVYTPHPVWDSFDKTVDPHWDELEQEFPTAINLLDISAPEQSSGVLEYFSSLPEDKCDRVDCGNKRHTLTVTNDRSDSAPEQKHLVLEQFLINSSPEDKHNVLEQPAPEHHHWIETYSPSNRREHKYYRYCWMQGRKLHHVHVPGGNTFSTAASQRRVLILEAIAEGCSPVEIKQLISDWRQQRSNVRSYPV